MNRTSIEWCRTYAADGTFEEGFSVNPVRFRPHGSTALRTMCQKVSPGCAHCYAEGITRRFWPKDAAVKFPGYTAAGLLAGEFVLDEAMLLQVLRTKKPARIFWGDMTDLFGEWVSDAFLDRMFAVCALTPHLTHIFLTKRAERMRRWACDAFTEEGGLRIGRAAASFFTGMSLKDRRLSMAEQAAISNKFEWKELWNVWLGVSVENRNAVSRIDELRNTPAAVRLLSIEPLLEDLGQLDLSGIDWVIVGGESGAGARPMHPDWARSLRDQCAAAGVPFFFKQWGEWTPGVNVERNTGIVETASLHCGGNWFGGNWFFGKENLAWDEGHVDDEPDLYRVGKKAAGDLLDGVRHHAFPEVRA